MLKRTLNLMLIALIIGPVAAFSSHLFLASLEYATSWRESYQGLIWTLPVLGFLMTIAYQYMPAKMSWGVTHLLYELREPRHRANPFLSLWIFVTSALAHLGGGSVGREGVGLIINGTLVDGIGPFEEDSEERSILLQSALSAGFVGMFGTPLAAIFFIFEINQYRSASSVSRWLAIVMAVFSTYIVAFYLDTPHMVFPTYHSVSWSGLLLMFFAIPLAAYLFYYIFRFFFKTFSKFGKWKMVYGGVILSILLFFIGTRYSGLGTGIILLAVSKGEALPWDWIIKLFLTALTIGIGFKGGEVTPLFFMGSTLGAAIGMVTGDLDLAKLGMVSLLGSLTHTPLSAGILGFELFGPGAFMWSFLLSLFGQYSLRGRHLYRLD